MVSTAEEVGLAESFKKSALHFMDARQHDTCWVKLTLRNKGKHRSHYPMLCNCSLVWAGASREFQDYMFSKKAS